jgi:hypothetical protein
MYALVALSRVIQPLIAMGFTKSIKLTDVCLQAINYQKTKIVVPTNYQRKTIEKPSQVLHGVKPSGWGCTRIWAPLSCCIRGPYYGKALPCRLSPYTLHSSGGNALCLSTTQRSKNLPQDCQAQELNNDLPGCYGAETHIL